MKRLVLIAVAVLILSGCNRLFGSYSHTSSLKDIKQSGQLQYTFSIPEASFAIGDTPDATVTVLNKSSATDAVFVGGGYSRWNWHLYNDRGMTVMFGGLYNYSGYNLDLAPHHSKEIY